MICDIMQINHYHHPYPYSPNVLSLQPPATSLKHTQKNYSHDIDKCRRPADPTHIESQQCLQWKMTILLLTATTG